MPGVAAPDVKWMLEGAAQRLKERYPAMFSTSERCKVPNVHLDVLREELFAAEVVARFGIASEEQFVSWLDRRECQVGGSLGEGVAQGEAQARPRQHGQ